MTDDRYNGWTNYETWCVKLWIDNDQSMQEMYIERAGELLRNPERGEGFARAPSHSLADQMRLDFEEATPEFGNNVFSDLLNSALSSVNWNEIAEAFVEDAMEEDAA